MEQAITAAKTEEPRKQDEPRTEASIQGGFANICCEVFSLLGEGMEAAWSRGSLLRAPSESCPGPARAVLSECPRAPPSTSNSRRCLTIEH